ncbi:MAG: phage portal protein [Clostridium neonatale]
MNNLEYYISTKYSNDPLWFEDEVKQGYHTSRIAKAYSIMNYLHGDHKVLERKDMQFKGNEFKVKKLILNNAKSICNFHSTYLLGNNVSLTGSKKLVSELQNVYNYGKYNSLDFQIADKLVKYGNSYEYIYKDGDRITSKLISNECAYPVYDEMGNYVAFIEYYTNLEHISYYYVYSDDSVVLWSNEGEELHIIDEWSNTSGLPIVYKTLNDWDSREGEGLLENIIPVLNEIEDLLSKMGDSIYTLSLSPISVTEGQETMGSIENNDYVGYNFNFERGGSFKYANSEMDYNSIKYYLDTIQNQLNQIAYMPSILGGSGNIANVSEVSLKMLYSLADVFAMLNERVIREGFNERFNVIRKLIGEENDSEYVNVTFNYARPQNVSELLDNIKKQFDMNAISIESIVEQSPLTSDKEMELNRLKGMSYSSEDNKADKVDD